MRGDTGPANHASGVTLAPYYTVLTDAGGLCRNGSAQHLEQPDRHQSVLQRLTDSPEFAASGWDVPPGIADATVPNPIFTLYAGSDG